MSEHIIQIPDYVPPFDPAARAVSLGEEIVRCRDCKRSEEWQGRTFCHKFSMSSGAGWPVEPDGFCAWGERKDA